MQRYRPYVLKDERLPELTRLGVGGFVIMPGGQVTAVAECCHYRVFDKHLGGYYHTGFQAGAVRVSFCGSDDEFWVELVARHATIKALQSLRRLMRHFAEHGRDRFCCDGHDAEGINGMRLKEATGWVTKIITARIADAKADAA